MHIDIARPMSREIGKLTEKKLESTPIGQKTLECIREGIENHFIRAKSVQDFLDDWKKTSKFGVCYGQAHAVMLSSHDRSFGKGKEVVKSAKKLDAICFQIFEELQAATSRNQRMKFFLGQEMKDINHEIEKYQPKAAEGKKWAKRKIKKLKKGKKEADKIVHKGAMAQGLPGVGILTKLEHKPAVEFQEKVKKLEKELLVSHAKLHLKHKEKFAKEKKDDFLQKVEKLHKENKDKDVQILVTMRNKSEGESGHAIVISVGKNKSLYDQNLGCATAKTRKEFFKYLREHFTSRIQGFPIKNFKIEVFHRDA